jgi:hypothetical protein
MSSYLNQTRQYFFSSTDRRRCALAASQLKQGIRRLLQRPMPLQPAKIYLDSESSQHQKSVFFEVGKKAPPLNEAFVKGSLAKSQIFPLNPSISSPCFACDYRQKITQH